jgi:hypothetical protein
MELPAGGSILSSLSGLLLLRLNEDWDILDEGWQLA